MSTEIYLPSVPQPGVRSRSLLEESGVYTPCLPNVLKDFNPDAPLHLDLSSWCTSGWKRAFDLACVVPALALLSPALGLIALSIRISSSGPVIFRQKRAGQHRSLFTIYKFRTMVENSEAIGPEHTAKDDPRITPLGRFLRRFKLDELPQLYNVLRGDMSLVGPRPKLANHEHTSMACRPGVTGAATLAFCNEQHILSQVPVEHLERFYLERLVPLKIHLDTDYMHRATLASDINVLVSTILRSSCGLSHGEALLSGLHASQSAIAPSNVAAELGAD